MLSLLRSEWYQARKSLYLKITIALIVVMCLWFGSKFTDAAHVSNLQILYWGSAICEWMSDGAMGLLLASLFAGWMIGGSFENRMIQESVSYGKKRSAVYLAKMIMYSLVVTVLCLLYWCASAAPAGIKNGMGTEEICGNLCHVPYMIGMIAAGSLAYISLFMVCGVVAFCVRKTGTTMGICFVGILAGGNLLASMVPENIAKIIRYTPLALYTHVTKTDVTWFDIGQTAGISIIWIILFGMAGYLKFRKTELK